MLQGQEIPGGHRQVPPRPAGAEGAAAAAEPGAGRAAPSRRRRRGGAERGAAAGGGGHRGRLLQQPGRSAGPRAGAAGPHLRRAHLPPPPQSSAAAPLRSPHLLPFRWLPFSRSRSRWAQPCCPGQRWGGGARPHLALGLARGPQPFPRAAPSAPDESVPSSPGRQVAGRRCVRGALRLTEIVAREMAKIAGCAVPSA